MLIQWSDFALLSLEEILFWYEMESGRELADSIKRRIDEQVKAYTRPPLTPNSLVDSEIYSNTKRLPIKRLPYVAFLREIRGDLWEIVDIAHTSRKLPK